MQRGSIRQNGYFWHMKYRKKVSKTGELVWVDQYHKLAPVDRQHQTEESVRALADVFLAPFNTGTTRPQSADQLITYLENFLNTAIGGRGEKLTENTIRSYRTSLALARPHLAGLELRKVRTPEINQIFYKVQSAAVGSKGGKGHAHTTYRNLKNFLSSAFRKAVGDGLVDSNPVRDAITVKGNPSDTYAYSLKEIKTIMKTLTNPVAKNAVMIFSFTGLRKQEVSGLQWTDYRELETEKYNGKILDIQRAVVAGEILDVKTQYSKAPVPVIATVEKTLAEHLKVNSGDGYVFHGDTGEPMRFENLARRHIIPLLEQAGIEFHGFHAFRRGLASTMKDMGVEYETIRDIMRHAPSDVTSKFYAKPSLEKMREALEKVEAKYKSLK